MKIAILGDTHWGVRNDNTKFLDHFGKFYADEFFPYLKQNEITTIIQLGDLFDRRKYVNFNTLSKSKEYFFDEVRSQNISLHINIGNHCTFWKNSNDLNSPELLLGDYKNWISVYKDPTEVIFDGLKLAMLPWVCSGNYKESMEFIEKTDAQILIGHLDISGFEMYRGMPSTHGFDRSMFNKFDMVLSGHFHHKSSYGNITYVGTPYEMTWSDWNDPRGFHVFDTDTRDLKFVENRYRMFHKIHYDDSNNDLDGVLDIEAEQFAGHMLKVIVHNKNNPYWFDMFIKKIEEQNPLDIQVVEDNLYLDMEDDDQIAENLEDTLTVLNKYTDQFRDRVDVSKLNSFLQDLYHEALSVE